MTREEYVKICKNCTNQKFDKQKGIICSLSNNIADFEDECSNYEEPEAKKAKKNIDSEFLALMKSQGDYKISSNSTKFGLYLGAISALAMLPIMIFLVIGEDFHIGMFFGGLIYIAVVSFLVYQFIYVCDAQINGDKVVLKKLFRPAKTYTFDKVGYPTSFRLKRTKYITVNMENDDTTKEKYLILNSKSMLSTKKKDAEQVLKTLWKLT